jgi:hypothetical protein
MRCSGVLTTTWRPWPISSAFERPMRAVHDRRTALRRAFLALGATVVAGCGGNEPASGFPPPEGFPSLAGARCYRLTYADSQAAGGLPKGIALQGSGDRARAIWLPEDQPVWMVGWPGSVTSTGADSLIVLYSSPRHYSRLELRKSGDSLHGRAQGGGHGPLAHIGWVDVEGVRFACHDVRHPAPAQPGIRIRGT